MNTKIPTGVKKIKNGIHEFEIEMSEDIIRKNIEVEDLPVAILMVDKNIQAISVNEQYYDYIHNMPFLNKYNKSKNGRYFE